MLQALDEKARFGELGEDIEIGATVFVDPYGHFDGHPVTRFCQGYRELIGKIGVVVEYAGGNTRQVSFGGDTIIMGYTRLRRVYYA